MTATKRAPEHLQALIRGIHNQSPKTLAFWRVTHEPIYKILTEFADTDAESIHDSDNISTLLPQVQTFFDKLNAVLSSQEAKDSDYQSYKQERGLSLPENNKSEIDAMSVVFGGKFPKDTVHSISESLVTKILTGNSKVYTVSRSNISYPIPDNLRHIAKQNLDDDDEKIGSAEFLEVMQLAAKECRNDQRLVLYLTLGQHKGDNPFCRNLNAAQNFCLALKQTLAEREDAKWQVVLTGTDATLPSDHEDSNFTIHQNETLVIPSYKIMPYNFVYAMSKLGQYYLVANAIAQHIGRQDLVTETEPVIAKIKINVQAAGENGNYQPSSPNDKDSISMEELDKYSRRTIDIEKELQCYLLIAKGISICYTPLHAKPWTQQALSTSAGDLSPKAYVLEQVVKRLKNAVSISQAVECHFS